MTSSSYRYPVRRGDLHRTHFSNRKAYLATTVGDFPGAQMCQAMHKIPGSQDPASHESAWAGFPWLTPVIGSGCLELPVNTNFTSERLEQIVSDRVDALIPAGGGPGERGRDAISGFAGEFTRQLVDTRASPAQRGPRDRREDPEVTDAAVRMVVLAALLTRFFHLARSRSGTAVSRWDDDVAQLPYAVRREENMRVLDSPSKVAQLARDLIRTLRRDLDDAPLSVRAASSELLAAIRDGLRVPDEEDEIMTLRLDHLRLVTEIAWYFLHERSPVYPGWTDLLIRMMLAEGDSGLQASGRPRPRFTAIGDLPGVVAQLLSGVTAKSWLTYKPREDDPPNTRDRLYLAVAEALWAQSDALVHMEPAQQRKLPVASAFVTSFDLELDMAMLATSEGRSFYIAVPVHVLQTEYSADAAFCWFVAEVGPLEKRDWKKEEDGRWNEQLARLRCPDNWRLLTEVNNLPLRDQPIIVHLNGCPLFADPSLDEGVNAPLVRDLRSVAIDDDGGVVRHAVTIDEYLALRQSSAELFWTTYHSRDTSRALPRLLTVDGASGFNPRFWMALGVPMDDPAVRNRFVAQMTLNWVRDHAHGRPATASSAAAGAPSDSGAAPSGQLGDPPAAMGALGSAPGNGADVGPPDPPRTDVHGVAVNTRMSTDEIGLLNWLGLDVIDGDCREFTADLRHYAVHVRECGPRKRPPLGEVCRLGEKATRP